MSEHPLPSGWSIVTLSEIASTSAGGTPNSKTPEFYDGDIPWLKIGDLPDGPVRAASRNITEHGLKASSAKWLPAGTLLVAMYGSIGKLGILTFSATTNQAICAIQPRNEASVEYLFWMLRYQRHQLDQLGRGGTQRNIGQTDLKAWTIPLAPRDLQDRIVLAIKDEFARLDAIEAELAEAERLASQFRQALLRDAFSGRLTHGDELPDSDELDENGRLILPEGWEWKALSEITENLDRHRVPVNRKERENRPGDVPYYGATGQVGWIDQTLFNEPLVLLGEDGVAFLDPSARKAYRIDGPSWVNNHAHVLRPNREIILDEFLTHSLNTISYHGSVNGSTRLKLTQHKMNDLYIATPPLANQTEIVENINDEFARLNRIQEFIEQLRPHIQHLRASVLHQAFTGRLIRGECSTPAVAEETREPAIAASE